MRFAKYNPLNRNFIILCSNKMENLSNSIAPDDIKTILNNKYNQSILDTAPYHKFFKDGNMYDIKSLDLQHSSINYDAIFNDDVKILMINNESPILSLSENLINGIAEISIECGMTINDSLIYIGDFTYTEQTDGLISGVNLNNLKIAAINKRNELNPLFKVVEIVDDNNVISNSKIKIIKNNYNLLTLKDYANMLHLDAEAYDCLKYMNQYNVEDFSNLKSTDYIFIPNTYALYYNENSKKNIKVARFYVDATNYLIKEVLS